MSGLVAGVLQLHECGGDRCRSLAVAVEVGDPRTSGVCVGNDLGQCRAVLSNQLAERRPPALDRSQAIGIRDNAFCGQTDVVRGLGDLALQRAQSSRHFGERLATVDGRDCCSQRVLGGALELRVRVLERGSMRLSVSQHFFFGCERSILVDVTDLGGVDLAQLIAQEVDLARA